MKTKKTEYDEQLIPFEPEMLGDEEKLSTEVSFEDFKNSYSDTFGVVYSADRKRLLKTQGVFSEYHILQGTEVICDYAFSGCFDLTSIYIPNYLLSIFGRIYSFIYIRINFLSAIIFSFLAIIISAFFNRI